MCVCLWAPARGGICTRPTRPDARRRIHTRAACARVRAPRLSPRRARAAWRGPSFGRLGEGRRRRAKGPCEERGLCSCHVCAQASVCESAKVGGRKREREREREIEREIEREREKEGPLSLSPPSTAPDGPPRPALPAQPVASRGAQLGETHRIQEGCSRRRSQNGNGSSAAIHLKMSQRLEIAEFRLKH